MLKKANEYLQHPLAIAVLLFIMIISLAAALSAMPFERKVYERPDHEFIPEYIKRANQVRNGQQKASVTILDPNETAATSNDEAEVNPYETALPASERVRFRIDLFQKLATQPLKFNLFDEAGNELTANDLETLKGEKLHMYLIHADYDRFLHLIPNYSGGVWNVNAYMPTEGTYSAFLVFDPIKGDKEILKKDLVVREATKTESVERPAVTTDLFVQEGPISAQLDVKNFDDYMGMLFDVKRNDDPAVIEPHFETLGQITLFRHDDPGQILILDANASTNENDGKVAFSSAHLPKGMQTAFFEFKTGNRVYIFPFTFDLK
ncbi:hypothetical protein GF340_00855 [Candidatus Peregrinibacteria bacterium]|nr:hypothetical protein [Candidatus Peregrinibacteria bacterium]